MKFARENVSSKIGRKDREHGLTTTTGETARATRKSLAESLQEEPPGRASRKSLAESLEEEPRGYTNFSDPAGGRSGGKCRRGIEPFKMLS
jgi:hypothetical protein